MASSRPTFAAAAASWGIFVEWQHGTSASADDPRGRRRSRYRTGRRRRGARKRVCRRRPRRPLRRRRCSGAAPRAAAGSEGVSELARRGRHALVDGVDDRGGASLNAQRQQEEAKQPWPAATPTTRRGGSDALRQNSSWTRSAMAQHSGSSSRAIAASARADRLAHAIGTRRCQQNALRRPRAAGWPRRGGIAHRAQRMNGIAARRVSDGCSWQPRVSLVCFSAMSHQLSKAGRRLLLAHSGGFRAVVCPCAPQIHLLRLELASGL